MASRRLHHPRGVPGILQTATVRAAEQLAWGCFKPSGRCTLGNSTPATGLALLWRRREYKIWVTYGRISVILPDFLLQHKSPRLRRRLITIPLLLQLRASSFLEISPVTSRYQQIYLSVPFEAQTGNVAAKDLVPKPRVVPP